jgi:hypothetical protein
MSNTKESIVLKYDDMGIPSIMLKVENTAKTPEEADRMFFVRGVEYDSIYLSRFVNCIRNGRAYSLPAVDPAVRINFDEAIAACKRKGHGWHLLTWAEWKYIREHTIPDIHGNTSFGKYHNDETEVGIGIPNCGRTLTGTGPANWFHNGNKETGIADVVGLVWKMIAGLRLKSGVIQYMPDNDAAAPDADFSISSEEFQEVHVDDLPFPDPVRMGANEDGELVITTDKEKVDGWAGGMRSETYVNLTEVPQILKDLGIITDDMKENSEWLSADADLEEAIPVVGGCYNNTSDAGPSALNLYHERSSVGTYLGFFSACLGEPVRR